MGSKKVIYIDIGTHKAQEFEAIFHMTISLVLRKYLRRSIAKLITNTNRTKFSAINAWRVYRQGCAIKHKKQNITTILIEPNLNLVRLPIYKKANIVLPLAIDRSEKSFSMQKLFLVDNDLLGQGSSLYKSKKTLSLKNYLHIPVLDAEELFLELQKDIGLNKTIILRLNCEGAEDNVIYAANKIFGDNLKLILGSLNDVKKIKGDEAWDNLSAFMEAEQLDYCYMSEDVSTWNQCYEKLIDLLN